MENSIRGLFSISSTNFPNPIAESTNINGSSLQTKFNWGETPITARSRNASLTRGNKNTSSASHTAGTPTKVRMSPSSHIDARTYVDIHSNGLASRIVKYHDNSTRLNRSLSLGNLYNKPGQFPVVHLKKNETQYKAKKTRNLSITRIAAPEKSVFHGNTLSSILRSGSVVGLQKTDEEISRENRPILHPPPTEGELAPTRSVLEVLKEISRKRINSDDIDGTELIKKHCKELDAGTYNGHKAMQSKRQREGTTMPSSSQVSPEQQVVKKRMCNYNNAILSSLSSSMPKQKKAFELENQTTLSSPGSKQLHTANATPTASRDEKVRAYPSLELENFVQTKYTPVTPLPSTPQQAPTECVIKEPGGIVSRRASEPTISSTKPKLTLFNKNYDDAPDVSNDMPEPKDDDDLSGIQFVKPKKSSSLSSGGTLLIEKMKKSKLALMLSALKGELNEDDEVDTPQKDQAPVQDVQASTSVASSAVSTAQTTSAAISFKTTTTTSTTPITLPTVSTTSAAVPHKATEAKANPPQLKESTPVSASSTIGISLKLGTTPSIPTATTSSSAVPCSANTALPPSSNANSIPTLSGFSFGLNKPLSLPTVQPQTAAPAATTQTPSMTAPPASSSTTAPTTTEAAKPFTFGSLTTQASSTSAPAFTFGSTAPLTGVTPLTNSLGNAQTTSTTASSNPAPIFGQAAASTQPTFTFGSLAESKPNTTSNAPAATTSAPATIAPPAFNFGAPKTSWDQSATGGGQANPLAPSAKGTFSAIAAKPAPQPATSTTASIGGFSFGATSSTEPVKPLFGSPAATTTNQAQPIPSTTFSFTANKPATAQTNAPTPFTFGSPATSSSGTAAPAQPTPVFGATTPVKPSNSFNFGSTAPAAPLKGTFSFSATEKPAAPSTTGNSIGGFSFNAPSTNSAPAPDASKNLFATATTLPAPDASKSLFGAATSLPAPNTSKNLFAAPTTLPAPEASKNLFAAAATTAPTKSVFTFGASTPNQTVAKPTPNLFGAQTTTSTNLFGAPATTTAQSSPFTFGSPASTSNQAATAKPALNSIFGAGASSATSSSTTAANSIFGGQSTTAAAPQPSSSFTFGASSSNAADTNKPSGGFVFGSSSSIGSNASKPATNMNTTFVFGDGSTTITPAPAPSTNLFGGSNALTNINTGSSENKVFSFGASSSGAAPAANNAFGASRQTVNQSPVFNFGASSSAPAAQAPSGNLFAPQAPGTAQDMKDAPPRQIRKAMRRLHKT